MRKTAELHEELVNRLGTLLPPEEFFTNVVFQPMPKHLAKFSAESGGNVIGFDRVTSNALMLTVLAATNSSDAVTAVARQYINDMLVEMEAYVRSMKANVDLVYLSYAGPNQDPLGSYGAENVEFLKRVARRFDPDGFFQDRIPGGFKISRVG
jgi:hypothetical protein